MSNNKEIKISATMDTAAFDQQINDLKRKLKDLQSPSDTLNAQTQQRLSGTNLAGAAGQPNSDATLRSTMNARRELDNLIRTQAQNNASLNKEMKESVENIKKMVEERAKLVKGSKEELDAVQKIGAAEENNARRSEQFRQRNQQINDMLDAKQNATPRGLGRIVEAYKNGSADGGGIGGGLKGAAGAAPGAAGGIFTPTILAGIFHAIDSGVKVYRSLGRANVETSNSMGSAISNTAGKDVSTVYGGRSAFEMNFSGERSRAAQHALEASRTGRNADVASLFSGLAKNTAIGATIGSVIPGFGTAAGAAGGFLKGANDLISDPRQFSLAMSPFSSKMRDRYDSIRAKQLADDYSSNYESEKAQNPFKTAAVGEYEQNFQRNLSAQRMMGMGNNQFYKGGGYLSSGIKQGFTPEMMLNESSGIIGSGGSTRMAQDSSYGLQLARSKFGLTNSAQVLGSLSSGVGSSESTKTATVKVLAEGMRLGLDSSKFAEENRRFTQAAADIISRSGGATASDFARSADSFGGFVAEKTGKGLDAAKSSYEKYQDMSSETSGPRGVMRAAGFMKDSKLSKLSTISKQALMQMPENQLTSQNQLVISAADETGTTPEDIIDRINGITGNSVSRFGESDAAKKRLKGYFNVHGMTSIPKDQSKLPKDVRKDLSTFASFTGFEGGFKDSRGLDSFMSSQLGLQGATPGDDETTKKMNESPNHMENDTIRAMAADAGTVLKNFNALSGGMQDAALNASKFSDAVRETNAALLAALEAVRLGKGGSYDAVQKAILDSAKAASGNQPQTGKASK